MLKKMIIVFALIASSCFASPEIQQEAVAEEGSNIVKYVALSPIYMIGGAVVLVETSIKLVLTGGLATYKAIAE